MNGPDLQQELREAEERAATLREQLRVASGTCAEVGHHWIFYGGRNAGCDLDRSCGCSVSVNRCTKCGDYDYGDNPEADEIRAKCRETGDGNA